MCCLDDYFFFNDTATTEIYTLSLHDALPIYVGLLHDEELFAVELHLGARPLAEQDAVAGLHVQRAQLALVVQGAGAGGDHLALDRKSTRLNSSHANISYAVFCLKQKSTRIHTTT